MSNSTISTHIVRICTTESISEILKNDTHSFTFLINVKCMNKSGVTTPKLNGNLQLYSEARHVHSYSCKIKLQELKVLADKKSRLNDIQKLCEDNLTTSRENFSCLSRTTRKKEVVNELSKFIDQGLTTSLNTRSTDQKMTGKTS